MMPSTGDSLPQCPLDASETGCCPRFDPTAWDDRVLEFPERQFVLTKTINFLHVPLNIGRVFTRTWSRILAADAASKDTYLVLSTNPSPWRGEHYFLTTRDVPGLPTVHLRSRFRTRVFEGPFSDARHWVQAVRRDILARGERMQRLFFFFTTCPKCAKHFGKNYVVSFAEL